MNNKPLLKPIQEIEQDLNKVRVMKEEAVIREDYLLSAKLRDEELKLLQQLEQLLKSNSNSI